MLFLGEGFEHLLGNQRSRGRVLAGDQLAAAHRMSFEVVRTLEFAAEIAQPGFEQERHRLDQPYRVFLGIGEGVDAQAFDDRPSVGPLGGDETGGAVADRPNDAARVEDLADHGSQSFALGEIEHRSVAAGKEDAVEIDR